MTHGPPLLLALVLPLAIGLAGCERQMRNMYVQPRYEPGAPSPLFPDGLAQRVPVEGTVAYAAGDLALTSSGRRGTEVPAAEAASQLRSAPPPITLALLQRGRSRFEIHCLPCHSALGDGDGRVVRRGFPSPPSFHQPRLRDAPDRHLYDVISDGYGVMPRYGDRVSPEDRWAIVAYVRALQLSQHAQVAPGSAAATPEHAP
jgi:mono/diheme cytochrome c family protein